MTSPNALATHLGADSDAEETLRRVKGQDAKWRGTRGARVTLVATTTVVGLVLTACTQPQSGEPRSEPRPDATSSPATQTADAPSIDDLDLCELLELDDLPVRPGQGGSHDQQLIQGGRRCENTVSPADPFEVMVTGVSRMNIPFTDFVPPDGAQRTTIAGRPAVVGNPVADDRGCVAAFGVADGYLNVSVTDEIQLDVDPCDTVTALAEIVISRTPPPNEQ